MTTATGLEANSVKEISALANSAKVSRAAKYPLFSDSLPQTEISAGKYQLRFAQTPAELDAVLKLRFEVFNLELAEGLDASYATGRDEDEFDETCHHLLVIDRATTEIVGTYRLRTVEMAECAGGFYSTGEYRLDRFPSQLLTESVEIGRACIARSHRNTAVLFLLWQGLAAYMLHNRKRYLFGCCSLTSQDEREGWRVFRYLEEKGDLHPTLRVQPKPECECLEGEYANVTKEVKLPRLFNTYLRFGAQVCSYPAIDREFKTIDFLVIFDALNMDAKTYQLFFAGWQ
jgi:putative hemolysin